MNCQLEVNKVFFLILFVVLEIRNVLSEDMQFMIPYPILFYCEICQSVASITGRLLNYDLKMIRRKVDFGLLICIFGGTEISRE